MAKEVAVDVPKSSVKAQDHLENIEIEMLQTDLVEVSIAEPGDSILLPIGQWGVEIYLASKSQSLRELFSSL